MSPNDREDLSDRNLDRKDLTDRKELSETRMDLNWNLKAGMDPMGQARPELEFKSRDDPRGQDRPELEFKSRDAPEGPG
ncbi:hypothetical protein CDL15_Pgr020651 [Punica granatum]|uniref:Uncharacterized protein n=1 Tax=Punica granatum TaxID=22663 RepID=A0A218XKN8_PUNGR|nr:hypothetical protein CDL15_Pgr020651 [Punica granatum]